MAYYKFFSSGLMARDFSRLSGRLIWNTNGKRNLGGPVMKNRTFAFGEWFSERIPSGRVLHQPRYRTRPSRRSLPEHDQRSAYRPALSRQHHSPDRASAQYPLTFRTPYYPLPNAAGVTNNFQFESPFPGDLYRYDGLLFRLDHNSRRRTLFTPVGFSAPVRTFSPAVFPVSSGRASATTSNSPPATLMSSRRAW